MNYKAYSLVIFCVLVSLAIGFAASDNLFVTFLSFAPFAALFLYNRAKLEADFCSTSRKSVVTDQQNFLLNGIIEQFPGMVAVIDQRRDVVISNQIFDQCFNKCGENGCLNACSECDFLNILLVSNDNNQNATFSISKPNCPLRDHHYLVHQRELKLSNAFDCAVYKLFMFTDCTLLKNQEKLLYATAEKAHNAVKARDSFLATISHELRTPLSAIIGLLDLLKPDLLTEKNRELFTSAQASANRLNLLVSDILDFSKIEANQMRLDVLKSNIFFELSPQLRTFEALAHNKGIDFIVDWQATQFAEASIDWQRVIQIVNNLVSNAIKFTDVGSVVIYIKHNQDGLVITVRDSGCGMSASQMSAIYQPFVQADTSISRKFGGSGLGLSIVKNLVELMAGRIHLESEPDVGTYVCVSFPFQFTQMVLPPIESTFKESENHSVNQWLSSWGVMFSNDAFASDLPLRHISTNVYPDTLLNQISGRIDNSIENIRLLTTNKNNCFVLVADDDPINRFLFQKQLNKLGIEHESVSDGSKAYEYLCKHHHKVNMLITDFHMPVIDGYRLTELIRKNQKLANLVVIGCTAEDSRIAADRAHSVGMNDVLYKPYSIESLQQIILSHCCQSPTSNLNEITFRDVKSKSSK